jgi:zinc protease
MLAQLKNFWDNPSAIATQKVHEAIYKNHPYSKNSLGTEESVSTFTRNDAQNYYNQYMSPDGARLAIVGDIGDYDVPALVQKQFGGWKGPKVEPIVFPPVADTEAQLIDYPMNRDQIVLAFAKKSIARMDPSYDLYNIYTQIFGGGVLNSMSSRLFALREATGLFYNISGSLVVDANEQPGICMVKTIVSKDRLAEAATVIKDTIAHAHETLTEQECEEAKSALVNSIVDFFASNSGIAQIFLFLDRYNLPDRYFDDRAQQLAPITVDTIKKAVATCMQPDNFIMLRVGRID